MPFVSLGAFILIFGFFAFNGGSQARISSAGDGSVVALAITNTLLGCIGGGLAVLFIIKIFKGGKWSLIQLVNGCLSGLNRRGPNAFLFDQIKDQASPFIQCD